MIDKDLLCSAGATSFSLIMLLILVASPVLVPILLIIIGFTQFTVTLAIFAGMWALLSLVLYRVARHIK